MFNRILKLIIAVPLVVIMAFIVMMNIKLSYNPTLIIHDGDTLNNDLIKGLRGLKQALVYHADDDMQAIYPEGHLFLNAVYALAWSDFLQQQGAHRFLDEVKAEMHAAWKRIDSSKGRALFAEDMPFRAQTCRSIAHAWNDHFAEYAVRQEGRKVNVSIPEHVRKLLSPINIK